MSNHGHENRSRRMRSRTSRREPQRGPFAPPPPSNLRHNTFTQRRQPASMNQQPGASNTQPTHAGGPYANQQAPKQHMEYICAGVPSGYSSLPAAAEAHVDTDCGIKNEIRSREPIRCRECGHRIMYKKRTTRCTFCGLSPATRSSHFDFPYFSGAIRGSVIVSTLSTVARCVVARVVRYHSVTPWKYVLLGTAYTSRGAATITKPASHTNGHVGWECVRHGKAIHRMRLGTSVTLRA
jgi:DNA-directed RNA polymerase I, II, and III subunit RPABC4